MAGEVALEAADRLAGGLALAAAPGDVVAGGLMAAGAGDDDAVQRGVDLSVAALVEPLALDVARAGRDWRDACGASQFRRRREPLRAPAISPTSLAAISGPNPGSLSSTSPASRSASMRS